MRLVTFTPQDERALLAGLAGMTKPDQPRAVYFLTWDGKEDLFKRRPQASRVETEWPPQANEDDLGRAATLRQPNPDPAIQAQACAAVGLDTQHVVAYINPELWTPAAVLAANTGRALLLLSSLDDLPHVIRALTPRSLALVARADELGPGADTKLAEAAQGCGSPTGPRTAVGLVTGRDDVQLYDLVLKSLLYRVIPAPGRSLFLYRQGSWHDPLPERGLDGRLEVLSGSRAVLHDLMQACARGPVAAFSVVAHGRDDGVSLEDHVICGRARDVSGKRPLPSRRNFPFGGPGAPPCAWGRRCDRARKEPFPGWRIPARIVFLNSCSTWTVTRSVFTADYSLPFSFLDGDCAGVLASPFPSQGNDCLNVFFHHLVDQGATLGEIQAALNDAIVTGSADYPSLLLLGDPEFAVLPSSRGTHAAVEDVTVRRDGRRAWTVAVQPRNRHRVVSRLVGLPRSASAAGPARLTVEALEEGACDGVYCLVHRSQVGALLDLFSLYPMGNLLQVRLRAGDPVGEWGPRCVGPSVEPLGWRVLRRKPKGSLGISGEASVPERVLSTLHDETPYYRYRPASCHSLLRELRSATGPQARSQGRRRLSALELLGWPWRPRLPAGDWEPGVLQWLAEGVERDSVQFADRHRSWYRVVSVSPGELCPVCHNDTLMYKLAHRLNPRVQRNLMLCARCWALSDTPAGAYLTLDFRGQHVLGPGEKGRQSIVIRNPSGRKMWVELAWCFQDGAKSGLKPDPRTGTVNLLPGVETEIHYAITASPDTPPSHYWLRVHTMTAGGVGLFSRSVWVVPD